MKLPAESVAGTPLEADFNAAIARALDLGINHFDSGDDYWNGRHEVLLGRALGGRRREVLITSKFGNITLPDGSSYSMAATDYVLARGGYLLAKGALSKAVGASVLAKYGDPIHAAGSSGQQIEGRD